MQELSKHVETTAPPRRGAEVHSETYRKFRIKVYQRSPSRFDLILQLDPPSTAIRFSDFYTKIPDMLTLHSAITTAHAIIDKTLTHLFGE